MYLIDDTNYLQFVSDSSYAYGGVPRNYNEHPIGSSATSASFGDAIQLIPREEWPGRMAEAAANKSRLSDIRDRGAFGQQIPALDQNGQGYCWAYSTAAALQLIRAKQNQPYVQLSPHSVACRIKGFRDQGGWGAMSMDFMAKNGIAPDSVWPQKSMDQRYNTQETWDVAKEYRITEGWIDLDTQHASEADLTFDEYVSLLLSGFPCVSDFYWWGHSVCAMDAVDLNPGAGIRGLQDISRWGVRILNSWRNSWGENGGTAVLRGSKAVPDGACAPRDVIIMDLAA